MAGIYRGIRLHKGMYGLYEFFVEGFTWRVFGLASAIKNIDLIKGHKE